MLSEVRGSAYRLSGLLSPRTTTCTELNKGRSDGPSGPSLSYPTFGTVRLLLGNNSVVIVSLLDDRRGVPQVVGTRLNG